MVELQIKTIEAEIQRLESEIKRLEDEPSNMDTTKPPEKLPEQMEISGSPPKSTCRLSQFRSGQQAQKQLIWTTQKKAENEMQIKTNQDLLFESWQKKL